MPIRVAAKPTCKAVLIISEGLPRKKNDRVDISLVSRINGNIQHFRHWNEPWKLRGCGHVRFCIVTFNVRSS